MQWCSKHIINTIKPEETIDKNVLKLVPKSLKGNWVESLFLLSMDGGKKKIFFGSYEYPYEYVWRHDNECAIFVRFDMHPVLQEKDLTIYIYNDKIEFSDPKIKEVKRLRLSYDEYADPNTLELVDCSKE